jgi:hypothetical protein
MCNEQPNYGNARYDSSAEAWALASGWLADNFPEWNYDTDNKRIVIPISDSDPTGGGPNRYDGTGKPIPPASFCGHEQTAVTNAISLATNPPLEWVYVLPITGDEDPANAEGYGVGGNPCTGVCAQVASWMHEIADATGALSSGASIVNFKDSETIKEQIIKIMTTPFPSNVDLYIESNHIWSFAGQLNDSNSPQTVDGATFFDALNSNGCIGRNPPCVIGVESDEGTVVLDKLAIRYVQAPFLTGSLMTINGVINSQFQPPDYAEIVKENDLTVQIQEALENCPPDQKYCNVVIEITGTNEGYIELSNLMVDYEYYDLEEEILEKVLACWRKSKEGHLDENLLCDEITIGEIYEYTYPITEESITRMLLSKNICHIFENSDMGCGDEDMLRFEQNLFGSQNILIEYNKKDKQVIVS